LSLSIKWQGPYRGGQVTLTANSKDELNRKIDDFSDDTTIEALSIEQTQINNTDYPKISGNLGTSAAIMAALTSEWGRKEPRTEKEITEVLKMNAIYFSQGSISGTLNYLTKSDRLRRLPKDDKFAYTPIAEALVTA
jgi:hypothetical protein